LALDTVLADISERISASVLTSSKALTESIFPSNNNVLTLYAPTEKADVVVAISDILLEPTASPFPLFTPFT